MFARFVPPAPLVKDEQICWTSCSHQKEIIFISFTFHWLSIKHALVVYNNDQNSDQDNHFYIWFFQAGIYLIVHGCNCIYIDLSIGKLKLLELITYHAWATYCMYIGHGIYCDCTINQTLKQQFSVLPHTFKLIQMVVYCEWTCLIEYNNHFIFNNDIVLSILYMFPLQTNLSFFHCMIVIWLLFLCQYYFLHIWSIYFVRMVVTFWLTITYYIHHV